MLTQKENFKKLSLLYIQLLNLSKNTLNYFNYKVSGYIYMRPFILFSPYRTRMNNLKGTTAEHVCSHLVLSALLETIFYASQKGNGLY